MKLIVAGDGGHHDFGCLRVFGGVGQRLGDNVIRGNLNRFGHSAIDVEVELDGHGRASGERLDRRAKSALRQDRGMHASRYLLQFRRHTDQAVDDVGHLVAQLLVLRGYRRLDRAQFEPERNDALLRTVVEVAFEAPAGLVAGGDNART